MTDIDYRPRSATEILDASFHLLRDHYRSFVLLTAVAYFPLAVFTVLFSRYAGLEMDPAVPVFDWNMLILMLVQLTMFHVMTGVVAILASRAYLHEPLDPGSTWRVVAPRLPAILITGFIVIILSLVGFILLVFPALYFYTRFGLAPLIAAIEGTDANESLTRASLLSEGQKLRIFGVTLLALVLYFILSFGFSVIAASLPGLTVRVIVGYLSSILVWPTIPIVQTILYYDLRIRAEGYDVDLMSRRLDSLSGVPGQRAI